MKEENSLFRKILSEVYTKHRNLLLYSAIGVTGVSLNYFIFFILISSLGIHYQLANMVGVFAGITNNYILNARYNFKVSAISTSRYSSFFAVGIFGLILSSMLLYFFYRRFGINVY